MARSNASENASLFRQDSVIRRIDREALSLLGGGRAILLQLAHPLVAAGVNDYSAFQSDPLQRLYRTLDLMHTLVSGDRRKAYAAARRFRTMHRRVEGQLSRDAGGFPAATPYSGDDPHLKLWVLATLVDTSLVTYQQLVTPLSLMERSSYYADTLVLANLMGIPNEIVPPTLERFQDYMDEMLFGDNLAVTDTARYLAWRVLDPEVGWLQQTSARLLRFVTAGILPQWLREEYGLTWGPVRQRLLNGLCRATRTLRPIARAWLWRSPQLEGASALRMFLWPTG